VTDGSKRAIIAALLANAGIALAKFAGFLITQSASLLAEAVHSVADTSNQALLLLGGKRAARAADSEHPFGYGRERYFWSFVVALILFSMGGLFALYEGIEKVRHPHETENLAVAIGILVFAIILESISLRTAYREAKHHKSSGVSWWTWLRKSKQPELPVVLLEDIGAEIGLFFALGGVLLAQATDDPRWDAVGSIAIGVLLIVIAATLAIEMKGLLIGESASEQNLALIASSLTQADGVVRLIHLKTQHLGPDELLVGVKLEFDHSLSIEQLAVAIDAAEQSLRAAVPIARVVYIEPDISRAVSAPNTADPSVHPAG
jgi:cation diffusion facilitator family transporter